VPIFVSAQKVQVITNPTCIWRIVTRQILPVICPDRKFCAAHRRCHSPTQTAKLKQFVLRLLNTLADRRESLRLRDGLRSRHASRFPFNFPFAQINRPESEHSSGYLPWLNHSRSLLIDEAVSKS